MKITVDPLFSGWKHAYLRTSKDGRKRVDLVSSSKNRTTISYARYLKSISVGHLIPRNFDVDHIDGDNTNDNIENLQILHKSKHYKKTRAEQIDRGFVRSVSECTCEYCGNSFMRHTNIIHTDNIFGQFCSRSCNGSFSRRLQIQRKQIKDSVDELFSTVSSYWK